MSIKKIFVSVLLALGIVTTASIGYATANKEGQKTTYEIYPTPRNVEYADSKFTINDQINVVVDDGIDQVTKDRAEDVFGTKGTVKFSSAKVENQTNVYIGTTTNLEGEATPASDYIEKTYNNEIKDLDFTDAKIDPYYVGVYANDFVIYGQNTNAAFYGVTTLMHVFNQIDKEIQSFDVYDYADTPIRGFIEGYYGIPWSVEDRISLMEFGGQFKMTSYVFAPKDDPYHKNLWRELYPEEQLKDMERMAKVGNASKCRFVWTAHPFMGGFNQSKVDEEIQALLKKFDQLYSVGVRQFGVLGDDAGSLPRDIVVQVMNAVVEWGNKKTEANPNDPVYDPVFCPGGYNHSWQGDYSELSKYDKEFSEQVNIFWTGEAVCQPVEQKTLDHFRTHRLTENGYEAGQERRAPLFWLNWPVNDINQTRMLMGRGELLHTDVNPDDLAGVVTNPMQEAEASKVAIFAVADYAWNVKGFDMDKSWADSFKYIDKDAAEELHTLAKHMSDPSPNNHGLVQTESEELNPLIEEYKEKFNTAADFETVANEMIQEMNIIIDACENFHIKSKNAKLKEELLPFTNALSDIANAIISLTNTKLALNEGDNNSAVSLFLDATTFMKTSRDYTKPHVNGSRTVVEPAAKRIQPFMNWINEQLAGTISDIVIGKDNLVVTAEAHFGKFTEYNGNKLEYAVDGKNDTFFWNGAYIQKGDYIEFKFSKPIDVYGIHILTGKNDNAAETFYKAKIKVITTDNPEGVYLDQTFDNYAQNINVLNLNYKNVTSIRFEQYGEVTQSGNPKWFAMREFWVDQEPVDAPVNASVYRTTEHWGVYSGNENNILDNNPDTNVHYRVRNDIQGGDRDSMIPGDFIGLQFDRIVTLGTVTIRQGKNDSDGDFMKKAVLEYSIDGTEGSWKQLGTYDNQRNITLDFNNSDENHQAKYIRLRITEKQNTWLAMRDFVVTEKISYNASGITNVEDLNIKARVLEEKASLEPTKNIALNKGQYIGLELKNVSYIDTITLLGTTKEGLVDNLSLEISTNGVEWTPYVAGELQSAKYVRAINNNDATVTFDLTEMSVTMFEYENIHIEKWNGLYDSNEGKLENIFDGDRGTSYKFAGSQKKGSYVVIDLGREIDFDSLKIVLSDSDTDYPRHAKISLSTKPDSEWKDIMFIGDQEKPNKGEAENTDSILDLFDHEVSYATMTADNLNKTARYIKFEYTLDKVGADKWVRFLEFEINGGGLYLPDAHPSFISNNNDTKGYGFNNMIDGDISTSFISKEKTGSFNYVISKDYTSNTQVKILQNNSKGVSNAKVYAVSANKKETLLGTLSTTLNVFRLPKEAVYEIKVVWENINIELYEIILSDGLCTGELDNLLHENLNKDNYVSGWEDYQTAIDAVKGQDLNKLTQEQIDNYAKAIKDAKAKLVLKDANTTELQGLVDSKEDTTTWTVSTKKAYDDLIKLAEDLLTREDLTILDQDEIDQLVADINEAIANKKIKATNVEEFNELINEKLDESLYTEDSWLVYEEALNAAKSKADSLDDLTQEEVDALVDAVKTAKESLLEFANTEALENLVNNLEDTSTWTTSTKDAYDALIAEAKALLETELTENDQVKVDELVAKINEAIANKKIKATNVTEFNELINENKNKDEYTAESWAVYEKALNDAKSKDVADLTQEEVDALVKALKDASAGLVEKPVDPVDPTEPSEGGLSSGAIAGIVIGSIAGIALLGGAIYFVMKKRK